MILKRLLLASDPLSLFSNKIQTPLKAICMSDLLATLTMNFSLIAKNW